jgi:uncharacterized paraquat-inducible protein A
LNTPELVTCLECGHQVSSAARSCPSPNCGTLYPLGRTCVICLNTYKASAGLETYISDDVVCWIDPWCYGEIQREYQSVQYTCPVCMNVEACKTSSRGGLVFPFFFTPDSMPACSECGHTVDDQYRAVRCQRCQTFLFSITTVEGWSHMHRNCAATAYKEYQENQERFAATKQSGCLTTAVILFVYSALFLFSFLSRM